MRCALLHVMSMTRESGLRSLRSSRPVERVFPTRCVLLCACGPFLNTYVSAGGETG
jgi:hypothetical protein